MQTYKSAYQKLMQDKSLMKALDRCLTNSSDKFDGNAFISRFQNAVKRRNEWAASTSK
jgi:hypothetical protein